MTRILVVEDNRNLATGLRNNLEIEGYEVEVAGDGTSGLAAARRFKPDLIVLDLMLPEMDGYRVLKTCVRRVWIRRAGLARGGEMAGARSSGADDYVAKTVRLLEFCAGCASCVARPPLQIRQTGALVAFGDIADLERTWKRRNGELVLLGHEYESLGCWSEGLGCVARSCSRKCGATPRSVSRTADTHVAGCALEDNAAELRYILPFEDGPSIRARSRTA